MKMTDRNIYMILMCATSTAMLGFDSIHNTIPAPLRFFVGVLAVFSSTMVIYLSLKQEKEKKRQLNDQNNKKKNKEDIPMTNKMIVEQNPKAIKCINA